MLVYYNILYKIMRLLYIYFLKPVLFKFDAENVHDFFIWIGEELGKYSIGRRLVSLFYGYSKNDKEVVVDGIIYKSPVILAAGFDYDGRLTEILPSMSFGGVEVGSVTAKAYSGNDKPRLTRLKNSKSILVNKGLKNEGVDAVISRLGQKKRRAQGFVIGVSVAQTNCKENVSEVEGIKDYTSSFKKLVEENVGDYYTVNISCPNAFGGEAFTTPDKLKRLLDSLGQVKTEKPVYVKMPINLAWNDFKSLLDVIKFFPYVKGAIVGNLNKEYKYLANQNETPKEYCGGLSGLPTRDLSTELIKRTREYCGKDMTIIGCGGIFSPEDAQEKIDAGANLLQLITGMIYEGPGLIKNICKEIKYGE